MLANRWKYLRRQAPFPPELGRKLAGRYGTGDDALDLTYLDGHLSMLKLAGGEQLELRKVRQSGDDLIADGVTGFGTKVSPVPEGIRVESKTLPRVADPDALGYSRKVARPDRRIRLGSRHPLCI